MITYLRLRYNVLSVIMNNIEEKVRECYSEAPFPNTLQASSDFNKTLKDLINWSTLNYIHAGLDLKNWQPKNILCAGCGTGEEAIILSKIFPKSNILAIDISLPSLEIAKQNIRKANSKNITLKQMSIMEDLPNHKKKYELVYSSGVIHHLQEPKKGFSILAKKLNSNGKILISLYNTYGLFFYKIKLEILNLLAGKNLNLRKKWTLRLRFHNGKDKTTLYDGYIHPQVKTYTIGRVMDWANQNNLYIKGTCPPLSFSRLYQFAMSGKNYIVRRRGVVTSLLNFLKPILENKSDSLKTKGLVPTKIKALIFQIIFFALGKGECFFLLEESRSQKKKTKNKLLSSLLKTIYYPVKKTYDNQFLKKASALIVKHVKQNKLLSFIISIAFLFRFWGLYPNLLTHDDEPNIRLFAHKLFINIVTRADFDPHIYKDGSLSYYRNALICFP